MGDSSAPAIHTPVDALPSTFSARMGPTATTAAYAALVGALGVCWMLSTMGHRRSSMALAAGCILILFIAITSADGDDTKVHHRYSHKADTNTRDNESDNDSDIDNSSSSCTERWRNERISDISEAAPLAWPTSSYHMNPVVQHRVALGAAYSSAAMSRSISARGFAGAIVPHSVARQAQARQLYGAYNKDMVGAASVSDRDRAVAEVAATMRRAPPEQQVLPLAQALKLIRDQSACDEEEAAAIAQLFGV
jgi:hypothetical protein